MTTKVRTHNSQSTLLCCGVKGSQPKRPALNLLMGMFTAFPVVLALPVDALEVQVTPSNPQLGDTLSVVINLDNPNSDNPQPSTLNPQPSTDNSQPSTNNNPTVAIGEKTYPVFEIAPKKYRALIPTTPLEKPGTRTLQITGDGQVQNLPVQVRNRKFPVQRINLPPGKAGVKATELELQRVAAFKALQTPSKYWSGVFLKPNAARMSTRYGVRRYYNGIFAQDYYHRGVDYAGATGSPVIAPADGRVALVGTVSQGFRVHGNVIGIDHGQGVTSIFMHLNRINVKEGDFVKAGQKIGGVGSTGASTGPHLHWGLYVNGLSVDPIPWLNKVFN